MIYKNDIIYNKQYKETEKTEYSYDENQKEREERAEKSCRMMVWSRGWVLATSGYFWVAPLTS